MANIIYGDQISLRYKRWIQIKIEMLNKTKKRLPKLVVILIGNHPASLTYVRNKKKACEMVGILIDVLHVESSISQLELENMIQTQNQDKSVDGILLQLPLPNHIDELTMLRFIDENKDVDGFHPNNIGHLSMGDSRFVPCTPLGILELLKSTNINMSGKHAVVIGRSNIVGKPIAALLLQQNASVTILHSKSSNIKAITKTADILVVAIGKAKYITKEFIKDGAIVIDVGINRLEDHTLCGDVDFHDVVTKCSYITPVPKGVGPMTIAMLLWNTYQAYCIHENIEMRGLDEQNI